MKRQIQSFNVSSEITRNWGFQSIRIPQSSFIGLVTVELGRQPVGVLVESKGNKNHPVKSLETLVKKWEENPERSQALRRAREKLAARVDRSEFALARLRLSKGLSQTQLAERMNVRQSYIARIETDATIDLKFSTIERLAKSLNVDVVTVTNALLIQRMPLNEQLS